MSWRACQLRSPRRHTRQIHGCVCSCKRGEEGQTHIHGTSATAVDEGVDGSGVIDEIHGDGGVGQLIAVRGDEVLEVGRDLLGLGVAHALPGAALDGMAQLGLGGGEDGGREGRGGDDEGAHVGGVVVLDYGVVRRGFMRRRGKINVDARGETNVWVSIER